MSRSFKTSSCLVLGLSMGAYASMAGDFALQGGAAFINPSSSLSNIKSSDSDVTSFLSGTDVSNNSTSATLSVSASYMITDNIGSRLTVGIPPQIDLNLSIPALGSQLLTGSSVRVVSPVVSAQYYFFSPDHAYRPYAGLGVSYVSFSNIHLSSKPLAQALAGTYQHLDPTWAPVFTVGSSYRFNDHWSLVSSLSYMPLTTKITLEGPGNGSTLPPQTTTADLKVNPLDTMVQISYTF